MLIHPELALAQAHQRHRELIAEADRHRLLRAAWRHRRGTIGRDAVSPAARGRPTRSGSQDVRVAAAR